MGRQMNLSPDELQMLQEVVAYMSRRFFDPRDAALILAIEDRLEAARRARTPAAPAQVRFTKEEAPVLQRVLAAYGEGVRHPAAAAENRSRHACLKRIGQRLQAQPGKQLLEKLFGWLRLG